MNPDEIPGPVATLRNGDVVQVGNGYQEWTVLYPETGGHVRARSNPSRQTVASGAAPMNEWLDRTRLKHLSRDGRSMLMHSRAVQMGVDLDHCSGCYDTVIQAIVDDENDEHSPI